MTTRRRELPFLVFALLVALGVGGVFVLALVVLLEGVFIWAPVLGILLLVAPGWALQVRDRRRAAARGRAQTPSPGGMPFFVFALVVAFAVVGAYFLALFLLREHVRTFWPVLNILLLITPWWALQMRDRRRAARRAATLRYRTY